MISKDLIAILDRAQHVVFLTGAGTSAESGVPTFRDAQTGLWAKYEPTELATPEAFQANPKLVWDWYQWRREKVLAVEPNPGHQALVQLEKRLPKSTLITQNVDGLHQQAGSSNVIELHGNILRAKCFKHSHIAETYPEVVEDEHPICMDCGSLLRPDVVWFNESLPESAIQAAEQASRQCDVFFSIGTSSVVYPAAALAFNAAQAGATVVEVNPNPTPLSEVANFVINEPSGEALPEIAQMLS